MNKNRIVITSLLILIIAIVGLSYIKEQSKKINKTSTLIVKPIKKINKTSDPVILAAGDLHCGYKLNEGTGTAELIEKNPEAIVLALGDLSEDGLRSEFFDCYEKTWGRFKDRTYPTLGNHELHKIETPGQAYFEYFGERVGKIGEGNYSFNKGKWHLISINSMPCSFGIEECQSTLEWLKKDLESNPASCTLLFMHYPRFSSGANNTDPTMEPIWDVLYANNVDVVLSGHDHDYERLALMDPKGNIDKKKGIRGFVVGTAGHTIGFSAKVAPNSEVRQTDIIGILKMALHDDSYEWEYIPEDGQTFSDYGNEKCR